MKTALTHIYVSATLLIANVSCLAISSFSSISHTLPLHSPVLPGSQSATSSQLLNLTRHHHYLNAGLTFECSSSYGRNLQIDSVMTAWRHMPRDKEPMTFAHKGGSDVHLPKRFLGRTYLMHPHSIRKRLQITNADFSFLGHS